MCRVPKAGRICKYIEDRIRTKTEQTTKKKKKPKNPTKNKLKKQGKKKKRKDTVGIHARLHTEE